MIIVYYRNSHWKHPQIKFMDDDYFEFIVTHDAIKEHISKWIEVGLNQPVLAYGYNDDFIHDVHIKKQEL